MSPTKDTYHHGNLRQALLDEALAIIGDEGVEGLSLRSVASRVGVSHAAPYHHFADKAELIQALAHEGMGKMEAAMGRAAEQAHDTARDRLLAIGLAYVCFATEHPDYYAAFTTPEMAQSPADDTHAAHDGDMWGLLMDAVIDCQRSGDLSAGDPMVQAVYLWSLVHGLVELWRNGPLSQMPGAEAGVEPLARAVLSAAFPASAGTVDSPMPSGSVEASVAVRADEPQGTPHT